MCNKPIYAYIIWPKDPNEKAFVSFKEPSESTGAERIPLPCGKCQGCRMDYSRSWMARIVKEASCHEHNAFLTLTYDDEHLPIKEYINEETGELITGHPVVRAHMTAFVKRLRRTYKYHFGIDGIRYYGCGEYGGRTMRPHYHLAIFGADLGAFNDVKVLEYQSKSGWAVGTSAKIEAIWGKGMITIGELTPASAGYIARYMLKKQKGPAVKDVYKSIGLVPEFTSMSTKGGVAEEWYELCKAELWDKGVVVTPRAGGGVNRTKIPSYFWKKLETEAGPGRVRELKQARTIRAKAIDRLTKTHTTLYDWELGEVREALLKDTVRSLVRCYETNR